MEFHIKGKDGAVPCLITADEDNGRYMIRKEDTSGEVFNDKTSLINWIEQYWTPQQFESPAQFHEILQTLKQNKEEQ
ncbi:hypothetical protein GJU40_01780 [Bacillus lacus]|uniref:Threonine dehydratase n=1 Tax=Metabacillus lacus TaxID=1983721 RepID=A0A7X2LYH9_9BACI|nr:hypothetical protein [Metabacillus lacus]MRX70897.1 hypothetical protein [Metabacillus lacus]